eukprot:Tamp_21151.p2 GENE.Tamp_21151~~Tamp_21151.p2  ORF type:complete len:121 (-),score=28.89 Tamp_21151:799-1134(-)
MAFRASAVALFRATTVPAARRVVPPDAPTQILLRQLGTGGPQTVQQLWESVEATGKFPSKNIMKHSLDFLRSKGRIEAKPQDPKNHKVNFVYTLGAKPEITPMEEAASSAG